MSGEQACVDLTFGREAGPGAIPAEWFGHRGDHAHFSRAVAIPPPFCHFAGVRRVHWLDPELSVERLDNVTGGDDVVEAPAVGGADIHVLDESQDVPGPFEVSGHVDDGAVVDTPFHDHVYLDGAEPGFGGSGDPVEHPLHAESDIVHGHEHLVVHRVEADRDPVEPGRGQIVGLARQQDAVGGECEVLDIADPSQRRDEVLDPLTQKRLPSGESKLADAVAYERAGHPVDLLEAEKRIAG